MAKVDNRGVHALAKPVGELYKSEDERHRDPAGVLASLVSSRDEADAGQRWKPGREIAGASRFVGWAHEHGCVIDLRTFAPPANASAGGEHIVYADERTRRIVKLTKPGLLGAQAADAGAYMQRMALGNRLFGDDVWFEGILMLPGEEEPRTMISQPFIEGRDASTDEQVAYVRSKGFVEYHGKFVHPVLAITVWDSFTSGNIIAKPDGTYQAIDLQIEPATEEELEAAQDSSGIGKTFVFGKRLERAPASGPRPR